MQIITRSNWQAGEPKHVTRRGWSVIDHFIVHHSTGATLGADQSDDWMRNIQKYHMDTLGWADIGYNVSVDHYGQKFEGRGFLVVGAHCPDFNTRSVGVVYLGDGRYVFSEEAKRAIREIYEYCNQQAGRTLIPSYHSKHRPTACPGDLPRAWVEAGMPVSDAPSAPAPPPPRPALPPPEESERDRIRQLQRFIGTRDDGIWGPNTEAACRANYLGWSTEVRRKGYRGPLPGNLKPSLVAWVQTQINRRCRLAIKVDGRTGPETNHGIVVCLCQGDSICGPKGYREACN